MAVYIYNICGHIHMYVHIHVMYRLNILKVCMIHVMYISILVHECTVEIWVPIYKNIFDIFEIFEQKELSRLRWTYCNNVSKK
jgi:hypothetical protein